MLLALSPAVQHRLSVLGSTLQAVVASTRTTSRAKRRDDFSAMNRFLPRTSGLMASLGGYKPANQSPSVPKAQCRTFYVKTWAMFLPSTMGKHLNNNTTTCTRPAGTPSPTCDSLCLAVLPCRMSQAVTPGLPSASRFWGRGEGRSRSPSDLPSSCYVAIANFFPPRGRIGFNISGKTTPKTSKSSFPGSRIQPPSPKAYV